MKMTHGVGGYDTISKLDWLQVDRSAFRSAYCWSLVANSQAYIVEESEGKGSRRLPLFLELKKGDMMDDQAYHLGLPICC